MQAPKHNGLFAKKIWLVGASQGIGLALLQSWLREGAQVVASARKAKESVELQELANAYPNQLYLLNVDVTADEIADNLVTEAWQAFNGLDAWFYNVGSYYPMSSHDWDLAAFIQMNHANYLGAVKLMLLLRDYFVAQGHGRWVWNASVAGYFGLPYGGGYSAPKAALINLAESLQPELAEHGIRLQIINHGFVKTRLTAKNDFTMPGLMTAEEAAAAINKGLAGSRGFEVRFPRSLIGFLSLLKSVPYRFSLAITRRMLKPQKEVSDK
ncbi:SDR family oxidoreductase [Thiomicrospira sp. ALE5]|uniref:SDR family NAD(P)-dependent oxidoreductase n=1 Tax=Thiomicrospira sp. ALE5 TaxID=748650 RepID=UPI0008E05D6D|nr:SDR family NAD(P)-dependent oxidoreductase [Thiomicrospira sp. ALE5]SFR62822.1 Short-chain dehydrogenase [Thiomicrospira sp. ALE5]